MLKFTSHFRDTQVCKMIQLFCLYINNYLFLLPLLKTLNLNVLYAEQYSPVVIHRQRPMFYINFATGQKYKIWGMSREN